MRIFVALAICILGCFKGWGEVGCFRTPAQAAVQVGEQEGGGFRLVFVRVDPFGGRAWAGVRSCLHPERPVVLVAGEDRRAPLDAHLTSDEAGPKMGHSFGSAPDVVGGRAVRVVQADGLVRMEMTGVAMGSGRVGDRVWVRIAGMDGGSGRLELAVVQGEGRLEIER